MNRLAAATDAQKRARDALTFPEWGQGLTHPQWLERELVLRAHPWCRGMETWFLEGDGGEVLASCETFRTPARLGEQEGEAYAIASVFTEPRLRGRGHATALLDALHVELAKRPGALGSVLFSDVGARIYQRSGYVPFSSVEVVLPAEPGPALSVERLEAPLASPPFPAPAANELQLLPTEAQLDWHLARERYYARVLSRPTAAFHGARRGDALALWCAWHKEACLRVLWLVPGAPEDTAQVLQCAQRVAAEAGLATVRLWEPHPRFPPLPGERRTREGELPMARLTRPAPFDWRHVHRALWV